MSEQKQDPGLAIALSLVAGIVLAGFVHPAIGIVFFAAMLLALGDK